MSHGTRCLGARPPSTAQITHILVRFNVCSYVFAHVCLHVHVCTCVHAHTRACAHTHTLSRLSSFFSRALSVGEPVCLILTKLVSMCVSAHGCVQTNQHPHKEKVHITFTDIFFLLCFGIFLISFWQAFKHSKSQVTYMIAKKRSKSHVSCIRGFMFDRQTGVEVHGPALDMLDSV